MNSGPPPTEPRPGAHDRAWNDPPLFSYANHAVTAQGTNRLNKRVGFPTFNNTTTDGPRDETAPPSLPLSVKPPPIAGLKPPPLGADVKSSDEKAGTVTEDVLDSALVINKLEETISRLESKMGDKKSQEIRKRIIAMESKWPELNAQVRFGVHGAADCLLNKEFEKADKIQRSISVDWPSLCSSWMVGLKHLINEAKKANPESSATTDNQNSKVMFMKVNN